MTWIRWGGDAKSVLRIGGKLYRTGDLVEVSEGELRSLRETGEAFMVVNTPKKPALAVVRKPDTKPAAKPADTGTKEGDEVA